MSVDLEITWASDDQREIFSNPVRYNVIRCGRRWGKTKGAFQRLKQICLIPNRQYLWVDTTQANIEKYFNEHLHPDLPKELYHWNKQQKILKFEGGSVVHFGSAERPENLEGFGYHEIFLNEAGIILKGESGARLWNNTIRPMTIEHEAIVWFVGTPKGVGMFKEFSERGRSEKKEYSGWRDIHRTTYDNPLIHDSEIDALVRETHQQAVRQEIFADFLEADEGTPICSYSITWEALHRSNEDNEAYLIIWGVDPSQGGDDEAGLCKRRGNRLLEPTKGRSGFSTTEGSSQGADWILREYQETDDDLKPDKIMVDSIGWGAGWYDTMRRKGLPVQPVNVAQMAHEKEKFFQKRDELWFKTAKWLETGDIHGDEKLFNELIIPLIVELSSARGRIDSRIKIESKEGIRKRLGAERRGARRSSPNRADALIITFDVGIELKRRKAFKRQSWREDNTTWMSA